MWAGRTEVGGAATAAGVPAWARAWAPAERAASRETVEIMLERILRAFGLKLES